ncbi:LCP family protein [uncultured Traorella sp.]|uniref:LCP family protein n=1 Tax=uncultured Traorella sp. TaxID=1929048 RepID=UPI0025E9140B|nr:LCP family protein [uncultured Traorella sp.]
MSKSKSKKPQKNTLEIIFSAVFLLISIIFLILLYLMDKLPFMYYAVIAIVVLIIVLIFISLQMSGKIHKTNKTLGKIIMTILSGIMIFGSVYIYKTNSAIKSIVASNTDKIEISVIVMNDSPIESIEDLSQTIGNINVGDYSYIEKALDEIREVNSSFNIQDYVSFDRFADALYNGDVEAIILNEAFRSQFDENHPDFSTETRVIKSYVYEEEQKDISLNVDVTSEPFTVYITGIDQSGSISTVGRSDVNKVMTVNPTTHQIFIVDIPRDYYIPQVCQANQLDKLTHTGIFGVDCTVESVSNYMGIDINYYIRINFSSLEKIVDALGGIEVNSEYAFSAGGYTFNQGINYLNGAQALAFSRERYSFGGGDNVRIANQTRVLIGMIDKVTSPAIITNYLSFLDAISGTFQTNMSEDEINALIKMQLNDMRGWTITSDALSGTGGTDWTPANGFNAYVMYPDGTSLERVLGEIRAVKEGSSE